MSTKPTTSLGVLPRALSPIERMIDAATGYGAKSAAEIDADREAQSQEAQASVIELIDAALLWHRNNSKGLPRLKDAVKRLRKAGYR